jgi:hypothetical protein
VSPGDFPSYQRLSAGASARTISQEPETREAQARGHLEEAPSDPASRQATANSNRNDYERHECLLNEAMAPPYQKIWKTG